MTQAIYDESKIKTLSSLEHIRLRYGMYIGRLGDGTNHDDGIYVLVKEVIDNAIDEHVMGHGVRIDVQIQGKEVSVRDYGRGIPLGKVIDCVSQINTGAKYDNEVFKFSVGLNGVGSKAVNALSERFIVKSIRDKQFREAMFERGQLRSDATGATDEKNGTQITFVPDHSIFSSYTFEPELLEQRLQHYAYLNVGLTINYNGRKIRSQNGLLDLLSAEVGEEALYEILHHREECLEFCFTHTENYGETNFSFVNGQYTSDGGTHQAAFREGVLKGINEYANKSFNAVDVRDGMLGAVSIRINDPIFESQTKNKLGNTDLRSSLVTRIKNETAGYLHRHSEIAEKLLSKIARNEKVRLELTAVKKEAKELARKTALKVPNLKDCKRHLSDGTPEGEESMIFITEGQSAAGSLVSSRDVHRQAVFSLKGKPMNCYEEKLSRVYKNEELYSIMKALGVEDSVEGLRYQKVILATDADVDGLHIRNLLLTYFLRFFEPLVLKGHVHILETPLFRVRNKAQTIYAYSENERDQAAETLGARGVEITRFKGLGEISPKEFSQFIGENIRLIRVSIPEIGRVPHLLKFYMGKNTPQRRTFIEENLV